MSIPNEITFNAYQEEDGGYYAVAQEYDIVTHADSWDELKEMALEATLCWVDDDDDMPDTINLELVKQGASAV